MTKNSSLRLISNPHTIKDCKKDINSLAFHPDGKKFAAGSFDGSINIYCAMSYRLLKKIEVPGQKPHCMVSLRWAPRQSPYPNNPAILTAI